MGKKNNKKANADKLQEMILSKTMNSMKAGGSKESTKTSKETSKKSKASKEETKKASKAKETKKNTAPREAKYNYPADCTDALSKKKFRAQMRQQIRGFENKLHNAKEGSKEYKIILREYKEFQSTNLSARA